MNKPTIILLLILTIVSCGKKSEPSIHENQFQNKTFSAFSELEQDTLYIEFQDSTHNIIGDLYQEKIPWKITRYENADFLVLYNRVYGIKKTNNDGFECTYIGVNNYPLKMVERKTILNKELLQGLWVEKELYEYYSNDSIPKPPRIPAPPDFSEKDYQMPPLYEIKTDTISVTYDYYQSQSIMHISNSAEFITMYLKSDFDKIEEMWKIKKLTDSIMIIDKIIIDKNGSLGSTTKTIENIELIKKR